jgi:hypothetical protein
MTEPKFEMIRDGDFIAYYSLDESISVGDKHFEAKLFLDNLDSNEFGKMRTGRRCLMNLIEDASNSSYESIVLLKALRIYLEIKSTDYIHSDARLGKIKSKAEVAFKTMSEIDVVLKRLRINPQS